MCSSIRNKFLCHWLLLRILQLANEKETALGMKGSMVCQFASHSSFYLTGAGNVLTYVSVNLQSSHLSTFPPWERYLRIRAAQKTMGQTTIVFSFGLPTNIEQIIPEQTLSSSSLRYNNPGVSRSVPDGLSA